MAEVICALDRGNAHIYTPMDALSNRQQRQVYEAAANELAFGVSALGEEFDYSPGCFLVQLTHKRLVSFPFLAESMEEAS